MSDKIAVLLPCYNEALTIEKVVRDFRSTLPEAQIFVYDNNSTDGSAELAAKAGAIVKFVPQQGKGYVVRRMFQEVDADVYVMADADDTYPADEVGKLVEPVRDGKADMAIGDRLSSTYMTENKRPGHNFGNLLVCGLIKLLWKHPIHDVMTGYRVFSRRFVKTCPILSGGFEIETEMTLHTLDKRMCLKEIPIQYRDRPKGSFSKLNTVADGLRVLKTIFNMFRFYRPFAFFGGIGCILFAVAAIMAWPVFCNYFRTGAVPRFPTLIFACSLLTASLLSFAVALVLDAVKKQSDQAFELALYGIK
jgi:glycosyltransferase involved in cell wall biosynthesis